MVARSELAQFLGNSSCLNALLASTGRAALAPLAEKATFIAWMGCLNSSSLTSTELKRPCSFLHILSNYHEDSFWNHLLSCFTDANEMRTRVIVHLQAGNGARLCGLTKVAHQCLANSVREWHKSLDAVWKELQSLFHQAACIRPAAPSLCKACMQHRGSLSHKWHQIVQGEFWVISYPREKCN